MSLLNEMPSFKAHRLKLISVQRAPKRFAKLHAVVRQLRDTVYALNRRINAYEAYTRQQQAGLSALNEMHENGWRPVPAICERLAKLEQRVAELEKQHVLMDHSQRTSSQT
jgi:BMFP domain-containing protein YqiC